MGASASKAHPDAQSSGSWALPQVQNHGAVSLGRQQQAVQAARHAQGAPAGSAACGALARLLGRRWSCPDVAPPPQKESTACGGAVHAPSAAPLCHGCCRGSTRATWSAAQTRAACGSLWSGTRPWAARAQTFLSLQEKVRTPFEEAEGGRHCCCCCCRLCARPACGLASALLPSSHVRRLLRPTATTRCRLRPCLCRHAAPHHMHDRRWAGGEVPPSVPTQGHMITCMIDVHDSLPMPCVAVSCLYHAVTWCAEACVYSSCAALERLASWGRAQGATCMLELTGVRWLWEVAGSTSLLHAV